MTKPKVCASIVTADIAPVKLIEPIVDMFEVRIDMIGDGWMDIAKKIKKPWIATNRMVEEGGKWQGNEARRIEQLLRAMELGATIVDVECNAKNVDNIISFIKRRAKCLISFHDFSKTPSIDALRKTVEKELKQGADICKVVTTAKTFDDNYKVLQLISEFRNQRIVAFAMGADGMMSRVLAPIMGAISRMVPLKKARNRRPVSFRSKTCKKSTA
jgi:3-dehydroquinate dehydratase-1